LPEDILAAHPDTTPEFIRRHLLVAQTVILLQDQHFEHPQRIKRRASATLRTPVVVAKNRLQLFAEQLPVDYGIELVDAVDGLQRRLEAFSHG